MKPKTNKNPFNCNCNCNCHCIRFESFSQDFWFSKMTKYTLHIQRFVSFSWRKNMSMFKHYNNKPFKDYLSVVVFCFCLTVGERLFCSWADRMNMFPATDHCTLYCISLSLSLSHSSSIYISINQFTKLPINVSNYPYLSIFRSIFQSIYLSMFLSVFIPFFLFIYIYSSLSYFLPGHPRLRRPCRPRYSGPA